MYPSLPQSAAHLVPLPRCDGPKLKPFDFQGPQKIEFLEYLDEGLHAHVLKVRILGQIYALKLFRFVYDEDWLGDECSVDRKDVEAMSTLYNYSEPFSAECRAFGRLQETGYEDLAVQCFGYLLLDEEHERAMMSQFDHLEFNGNIEAPGRYDLRSRFPGKDGRPPPIRGIVKEFGYGTKELRTKDARRLLRQVIKMQQLGIIHIDVGLRQLINGKHCDFSVAITTPHYVTTPELNPQLTPEWKSAMEFETFQYSINDYWEFDDIVVEWNCKDEKYSGYEFGYEKIENKNDNENENEKRTKKIAVRAFPNWQGCHTKYNLRSTPRRERVYSLVDPRLYNWRTPVVSHGKETNRVSGRIKKPGRNSRPSSKTRHRLETKPPRWYFNCDKGVAADLKHSIEFTRALTWYVKDGLIFPRFQERIFDRTQREIRAALGCWSSS